MAPPTEGRKQAKHPSRHGRGAVKGETMPSDLEDRLIRIEQKLAHMERLTEKLAQANVDQELRIERLQNLLDSDLRPERELPETEH